MSKQTDAISVRTIGIDTGKNTLHLIGLDQRGTIVLREKLARGRIGARLANVQRCLIGIEAGMATHYVARELLALGHDVRRWINSDWKRYAATILFPSSAQVFERGIKSNPGQQASAAGFSSGLAGAGAMPNERKLARARF